MKATRAWTTIPIALLLGLTVGGAPAVADPPVDVPTKTVKATTVTRAERAKETLVRVEGALGGRATRQVATVEGRSLTLDLRDLRIMKDALSPRDQRRVDVLTARPTFDATRCATVICVHYKTSGADAPDPTDDDADGTPDYIELVRDTTQQINDDYVAAGYRRPKGDGTVGGGTDKVDVYIQNLLPGLYGYCTTEDDPPTTSDLSATAYCVLDNDYAGFPRTPEQNVDVTAAHEYFHAVQFAYDFWQEDRWLLESTATWAEDEMFDDVNDNRQYLSTGPLGKPFVPLDYFCSSTDAAPCPYSGYHYGTWIWWRYLTEKYPSKTGKLPNLVRKVWERLDAAPGGPNDYSLQGLSRVLNGLGTSLKAEFVKFSTVNRNPKKFYSEGGAYQAAPALVQAVNPAHKARGVQWTSSHLASATGRFNSQNLGQADWRLKVHFDLGPTSRGAAAVIIVYKKNGKLDTTTVHLNADGNASKTVPFSSSSVKGVDAIMVNTSSRSTCWNNQDSHFSCFGTPKDDGQKYLVTVKAFRS